MSKLSLEKIYSFIEKNNSKKDDAYEIWAQGVYDIQDYLTDTEYNITYDYSIDKKYLTDGAELEIEDLYYSMEEKEILNIKIIGDEKILYNTPMIHWSDSARDIEINGFKTGLTNLNKINFSSDSIELNKPGINYGVLLNEHDILENHHNFYKKQGVLFYADCIYTRHLDGFNQGIFIGQDVNIENIFLIEKKDNSSTKLYKNNILIDECDNYIDILYNFSNQKYLTKNILYDKI